MAARNVLANDSGPGVLQAVLTSGPAHAQIFNLQSQRTLHLPGGAQLYGMDSFRYRARFGSSYSLEAEVCITVGAVNDRPVAVANAYSVNGNGSITVPAPGVLANDTDADGDPLTAVLVSGPTPNQGALTLNADGSFTFTPNAGFSGIVDFYYRASDGVLLSNPSAGTRVRLTVTPPQPDFVVTAIQRGSATGSDRRHDDGLA